MSQINDVSKESLHMKIRIRKLFAVNVHLPLCTRAVSERGYVFRNICNSLWVPRRNFYYNRKPKLWFPITFQTLAVITSKMYLDDSSHMAHRWHYSFWFSFWEPSEIKHIWYSRFRAEAHYRHSAQAEPSYFPFPQGIPIATLCHTVVHPSEDPVVVMVELTPTQHLNTTSSWAPESLTRGVLWDMKISPCLLTPHDMITSMVCGHFYQSQKHITTSFESVKGIYPLDAELT